MYIQTDDYASHKPHTGIFTINLYEEISHNGIGTFHTSRHWCQRHIAKVAAQLQSAISAHHSKVYNETKKIWNRRYWRKQLTITKYNEMNDINDLSCDWKTLEDEVATSKAVTTCACGSRSVTLRTLTNSKVCTYKYTKVNKSTLWKHVSGIVPSKTGVTQNIYDKNTLSFWCTFCIHTYIHKNLYNYHVIKQSLSLWNWTFIKLKKNNAIGCLHWWSTTETYYAISTFIAKNIASSRLLICRCTKYLFSYFKFVNT